MSSGSELRRMTKSELKSWLNSHNQRLPADDRLKDYYLKRAMGVLKTLSNDSDESSDEMDGTYRGRSRKKDNEIENTPEKQAIRRRRMSVQQGNGNSSGASGGSGTNSRKQRQSRSRRNSMNQGSSVTKEGKRIVKTRKKTPIRNNAAIAQTQNKNKNKNKSGNEETGSKSKRKIVTRRKTQRKHSPASVTNSIKKKRNRMRRATDDPETLRKNAAASSRVNDMSESDSDDSDEDEEMNNNNNNFPRYWIDFDPKGQTILQLKQWLTEHNIDYTQANEKKQYYVSLVSKYSKSTKDDTLLPHNRANSLRNQSNISKKRDLSPNQKKSFVSPSKRVKNGRFANKNNKNENDSPPLPPNIAKSPLTPPEHFKMNAKHQKNKRRASFDTNVSKYNNNSNINNNGNNRKKGLLETPAILRNGSNVITTTKKANMRNEVRRMLGISSDTDEIDNDTNMEPKTGKNNEFDEFEDENDIIAERTRRNTVLNQYLPSRFVNDEIEKRKKELAKKKQKTKQNTKKQPKTTKMNNNNNNDLKSPFGMFGTFINRFSPAFGMSGKRSSVLKNDNISKNNNNNGISSIKNRLNYDNFDTTNNGNDSDDAMSPFSSNNISNIDPKSVGNYRNGSKPINNNINISSNNKNQYDEPTVTRMNLMEEELLRSDEENIPTDPESTTSPSPAMLNKYKNNNNNINKNIQKQRLRNPKKVIVNKTNINNRNRSGRNSNPIEYEPIRNVRKLNPRIKPVQLPSNYIKQATNNQKQFNDVNRDNNRNHKKNANVIENDPNASNNIDFDYSNATSNNNNNTTTNSSSISNIKNGSESRVVKFVSFCVAMIGILIGIALGNVFVRSLMGFENGSSLFDWNNMQFWQSEKEFEWFCDSRSNIVKGSVGDRIYNEKGVPCRACPTENIDFCENGIAYCAEHYVLYGTKCVLNSELVQMAHEIELEASKILGDYKGRADCGEPIDPGLKEEALKAMLQTKLSRRSVNIFEDGWKYFKANVIGDSMNVSFDKSKARYYGNVSNKSLICQLKLFFIENIISFVFAAIVLLVIIYWVYKYLENRKIYKLSKLMREYTYDLLKEQKLKNNPSYKAVSQLKQDNMIYFDQLLGNNEKRREKIWNLVQNRFETDAYIQCSQRTVDGIQKLCWQLSDTYLKSPSHLNSGFGSLYYGLNNNFIGNIGNSIYDSAIRKPLKFIDSTPLFRRKKTVSMTGNNAINNNNTAAAANNNRNLSGALGEPQSPSNVYGVPIGRHDQMQPGMQQQQQQYQQPRHSVTSPSRSFGVTPMIPRNQGIRNNLNNMNGARGRRNDNDVRDALPQVNQPNMPVHSKYSLWG